MLNVEESPCGRDALQLAILGNLTQPVHDAVATLKQRLKNVMYLLGKD